MKVLHIINSLDTGGAEKLVADSVPLYQKRGIEVDVLLLNDNPSAFRKQLEEETNGNVFGFSTACVYNPLLIFKLIPYLKKYDIVHAHLFPTLYWVVLAKCLSKSTVKLIYTEHNTENRRRNNPIFRKIDKFIYSKLSFIGCISIGTYENLEKHIGKNNKMRVINNGIDLSKFTYKNASYNFFSKEDILLIQVSSFRKQKDQETLINSLKDLPEKVKLLLVGDGDLIEKRKLQVKELDIEHRVKFLGKRYDIPELMSYSDIVVLSSHYEGFGLAIVEGMAIGKPVIASNVSGIREIVLGYGLLFEEGNSKELAAQITSLIDDKKYYTKIASQCSERAKDFDINIMVDKYINVYNELLNI